MRSAVRSRTGAVAAALTAAVVLAVLPAAGGAGLGETSVRNGEIAFLRESNVYGQGYLWVVNADGTRARRLLKSGWISSAVWSPDGKRLAIVDKCAIKVMPATGGKAKTILRPRRKAFGDRFTGGECYSGLGWSPDGKRLVFVRCGDLFCEGIGGGPALYVADVSGKGIRQLSQRECVSGRLWSCPGIGDGFPDWSPDGEKILFQRLDVSLPDPLHGNVANNAALYLAKPDGSGITRLPPKQARVGKWSPDGTRIAFTRAVWTTLPPGAIWAASHVVMNTDGSGERTLVQGEKSEACGGWTKAWSPDGTKLAYTGVCPQGIYVMSPNGSDRVRLTRGSDRVVDWRPLP